MKEVKLSEDIALEVYDLRSHNTALLPAPKGEAFGRKR